MKQFINQPLLIEQPFLIIVYTQNAPQLIEAHHLHSHLRILQFKVLHHRLTVLHADLHAILFGSSNGLLTSTATLSFIGPLLSIDTLWHGAQSAICLGLILTVLYSKFIDDDGLPMVRQFSSLPVNVLVITMTNNFTSRQLYLTGRKKLRLLNV